MRQGPSREQRVAAHQDAALLERCRARDPAALESLARGLLPRVRKTVFFLAGADSEADDLVQMAMVRIFNGLSSFRGESSLGTWVDAVTLNTVRQHRRRRVLSFLFTSSDSSPCEPVSHWPSPEDETLGQMALRQVAEHLQSIKPKKREATVLAVLYGYSTSEVAELVGCTTETAKKRIQHGRRELLQHLARAGKLGDLGSPSVSPAGEEAP